MVLFCTSCLQEKKCNAFLLYYIHVVVYVLQSTTPFFFHCFLVTKIIPFFFGCSDLESWLFQRCEAIFFKKKRVWTIIKQHGFFFGAFHLNSNESFIPFRILDFGKVSLMRWRG